MLGQVYNGRHPLTVIEDLPLSLPGDLEVRTQRSHCHRLGLVLVRETFLRGFPGGSDGKESACNAGDLGPEFLPGEFWGQRSKITENQT